ncbi:hypothetical protein COOONC_22754 [Cooperia oncophora]
MVYTSHALRYSLPSGGFFIFPFQDLSYREGIRIYGDDDGLHFHLNPCPIEKRSRKISQKSEEMLLPGKPDVEPSSRLHTVPVESPTTALKEDDEWERNFYERVKHDFTVPAYFKTTLGILVANNQDLRKERAFLHSHLSQSRP